MLWDGTGGTGWASVTLEAMREHIVLIGVSGPATYRSMFRFLINEDDTFCDDVLSGRLIFR